MAITRRQLSVGCGMGALAWTAGHLRPGEIQAAAPPSDPLDLDQLKQLAAFALERARAAGASYADIRINRYQQQTVALRSQPDFASGTLNHVPSVSSSESFGFGLRVLARGTWGFSASQQVTRQAIARRRARRRTSPAPTPR
jgi:TldD protein